MPGTLDASVSGTQSTTMPDITTLCAPVAPSSPAGEDLSLSPEFDQIAEARRADDPSLPQGDWQTPLKAADWARVESLCSDLLLSRSKDLRLVTWLTEAWRHDTGLDGIAEGLVLLTTTCDRYWDVLHPLPEDDEDDVRLSHLDRFLAMAGDAVRVEPLTQGQGDAWSLQSLEAARHASRRNSAADGDEASDGRDQLRHYAAALRATPAAFLHNLRRQAEAVSSALTALEQCLSARMRNTPPSFALLREPLEALQSAMATAGAHSAQQSPQADATRFSDMPTGGGQGPSMPASRIEAVTQLKYIAAYFRQSEPHNPVGYLAEKAAEWADMPLHQWLRKVMHDEGELAHLEEVLGAASRPGGGENETLSGGE